MARSFTAIKTDSLRRDVPGESSKCVLYVEDEEANWDVARHALRAKYKLIRACDAREAFQKMEEHPIDLILMDIQLAGSDLNGIELAQAIRGTLDLHRLPAYARTLLPRKTPIIFVTAYQARYTEAQLKDFGGNDLVTKPVDLMKLNLVMTRLLLRNIIDMK